MTDPMKVFEVKYAAGLTTPLVIGLRSNGVKQNLTDKTALIVAGKIHELATSIVPAGADPYAWKVQHEFDPLTPILPGDYPLEVRVFNAGGDLENIWTNNEDYVLLRVFRRLPTVAEA